MIIIDLIYNLTLLVALSVVSSFIGQRWQRRRFDTLLQGMVFGGAAVIGMLHPLVLSAGIIFDGRSVVISLCGLFFGPMAVGVAGTMAAICRILQGGTGTLTGLLVILSSALLGLVFHIRQSRPAAEVSTGFLLKFGLLVHVVMLLLMFTLPGGKAFSTLQRLALPVLLTYPLATVLIGKILSDKKAQRHSLEALRESTESFRTTLYSIGDAVISTDNQGRVRQMNPVAERLTGWLEAEARSKPLDEVFQIVNEETRAVVENPAQRVLREGQVVGLANHTLLIARDGTERPIADSGAPIRSAEGEITGVVLVFRDQSAERAAQEALREGERRFRLLFERMPLGYQSLDAEGRFLEVNPTWLAILGYERNDVIGHWFGEFLPPAYVEAFRQRFPKFKEAGEVHNEFDMKCKDGSVIHVAFDGKIGHDDKGDFKQTHCILSDITQRTQTEQALRVSEAKYRLLHESMRDAFACIDMDGNIKEFNDAFCQLVDYRPEELLLLTYLDLTPEKWHAREAEIFQAQVLVRGYSDVYEKEYRRKDGTIFPIEIRTILLQDAAGQPCGMWGLIRDITERKQAEVALRESEEHYRLLFNSIHDAVFLHGFSADNGMPGHFLQVNDVACQRYGYSREEWLHMRPQDLDAPEGLAAIPGVIRQLQAEGHATWEGMHRAKDGRLVPVEISNVLFDYRGAPVILSVVRDITKRKQTEAALHTSEQQYRSLVESTPDVIMSFDRQGRHLFVNPAVTHLTGLHPKEFLGKTHAELGFPEERCRFWETLIETAFDTGESLETEFEFAGSNGRVLFNWRLIPVNDGDAVASVLSIARDITAQRKTEEKYQMLFREMLDGFALHDIICDGQGRPVDYRFLAVNPAFERLTGLKAESLLGKTVLQVLPNTEAYWIDAYGQVALTGKPAFIENYARDLGRFFQVTVFSPAAGQFACIFADITERKRAEEALRANEARHGKMIANIGDVIAIIDQDEILRYMSPNFEHWFGWKPEEVVGFSTWENVHPEDLDFAQKFIGALLQEPAATGTAECRYRCKDGGYKWIEFTGVNLLHDPDIRGVLGNYRDITERKRAEEEHEKLQAQLLQAQKMESVGRLAGGVAHDFNNMLGVIMGHADIALEQIDPEAPLHDDLQEIQKAALRSADLTRQLLAFARKQPVSPSILDLNQTVSGVLMMLQRLIGEDIELAWKPAPALWPVKMDPSQVDQILANLAVNARDAIGGVGHLTIQTENTVFDESYCRLHDGFAAGDYVLLAVSDTGAGMDKETLEHVFEPFFTTKEVGKGTGLGLAMVYGAVKQNQGFINVYSEPGRGTTFKIYLPRTEAVAAMAAQAPRKPDHGTETVLLAEDEESILKLGTTILKKHGYTVLAARTPAEALARAERHKGSIHLLITDVVMPGMNGKELKDRLTALRPGIKVLFMSGYTSDVIAHQGVIDEGVAFLQKPFSVNTLAQKVREVLQ